MAIFSTPQSDGPDSAMKVAFVYKEDYPWDVRVEKIVKTLRDDGYDVNLICRNLKRLPQHETCEGFTIRRLPALPRWFGRLNALVSLPFFANPLWFWWIFENVRRAGSELIIVRDLPLMPTAILIARLLGRKVVFDMAECYPEMYASTLRFADRKLLKFIVKNPGFTALVERFSVHHADHVFVMIEESRDRLLRLGGDPARITIVSNTPVTTGHEVTRQHERKPALRLFYVGFVTRIRGIDNMLLGLHEYLKDPIPDQQVEVDIVGIGAALEQYRAMAQDLGVANSVHFHGWCDQEVVDRLFEESDIGILTYHVCSHWNHTIPNKLFDYMLSGMPVIATDVRPIQRIINEVGCGIVFKDGSADGFADALRTLANSEARNSMAERGLQAIKLRYNWDLDRGRMATALSTVLEAPVVRDGTKS